MEIDNLEERFNKHISNCTRTNEYTHFLVSGKRYVRCDKCNQIVSIDDCCYYGGEQLIMFTGGCRNCFGGKHPK